MGKSSGGTRSSSVAAPKGIIAAPEIKPMSSKERLAVRDKMDRVLESLAVKRDNEGGKFRSKYEAEQSLTPELKVQVKLVNGRSGGTFTATLMDSEGVVREYKSKFADTPGWNEHGDVESMASIAGRIAAESQRWYKNKSK